MEEFRTNPGRWKAKGNIIGDEIAYLTNLASWTLGDTILESDGTIEHEGKIFNVAKMTYVGGGV